MANPGYYLLACSRPFDWPGKRVLPFKEDKMKKSIMLVVCFMFVGSVFCGNVYAEAYVHDGLFLRLAPGIGWNNTDSDSGGNKLKMSGVSGLFNCAAGGAVSQDLILHLDASVVSTSDPEVKRNGTDVSSDYSSSSTSMVGIGMTYYFPSNFYLTGAVGIAESSYEYLGSTTRTDKGYGVNLMAGKEWWVSDNWGLGIAGQLLYTNCPSKPSAAGKPDVESTSFGVLFSATYN